MMATAVEASSFQQNGDINNCALDAADICLTVEQLNNINLEKSDSVTADNENTPQVLPEDSTALFPQYNSDSLNAQNITNSGKRNVTFPEGSDIISGYTEPPSPWILASTCTTEGLVNAYKYACELQNVKPIPLLLQQLNAINDFCDRNETLTLKGERLEAKAVEPLEEVLRRVQFRTIDVENTHLDEEGAIALFDMIEYYESATKLNIAYNKNFGPRGWQACARLIKRTPCLEYLDSRSCAITDHVMPMLGRSIRLGSHLRVLHLENSVLSGRPLMILVAAIKMNELLRELYLAENKLMPSDGIQLGNMLKFNHRLQVLDIRNNHLQDVGTQHICDGLYEQNLSNGLQTLVLWNNLVTYQSMPSLSRALKNTRCLETLNLGHNNLTNEGIHRLKDGLLHNKSLLRVGLQATKIACEGAVALAEFIADSPRLLRMDIRENDVKTGGIIALTLSLRVNQTITRLDMDKETKKESAFKDYAEQQKRFMADIANYLVRNRDVAREKEEQERLRLETEAREKEEREKAESIVAQAIAAAGDASSAANDVTAATAPKPQLELRLAPASPGAKSLESPGFVPASALTFTAPPTPEDVEAAAAAARLEAGFEEPPTEFPPSPMTSHARGRTFQDAAEELGTVDDDVTASESVADEDEPIDADTPEASNNAISDTSADSNQDNMAAVRQEPSPSDASQPCHGDVTPDDVTSQEATADCSDEQKSKELEDLHGDDSETRTSVANSEADESAANAETASSSRVAADVSDQTLSNDKGDEIVDDAQKAAADNGTVAAPE